jgi:hypothetical protein
MPTISAKMSGLAAAIDAADIMARMQAMKLAGKARDTLKETLREQMLSAGFSERMAKTWRGQVYPKSGDSLSPAAVVTSGAPGIVDAYARGVTIVARAGKRLLAVPTDDTPLERNGRAMSPAKVEQRFGKKLRYLSARSAAGSLLRGRATGYLIMDGVVAKRSTGRFKSATPRQLARQNLKSARPVQSVVMFTLVASVKVPKRLNLNEAVQATVTDLLRESDQ